MIADQTAAIADVAPSAVRLPAVRTADGAQTTDVIRGPALGSNGNARAEPVIAIAHDYLTQRGGAERVVLAMLRAFPNAKLYTTLYDPDGTFPEFRGADIIVSPLNRIGALRRNHRLALPLLAVASSRMHIPADVVIASSSGWAHGFRSSGRMIVYCHTPARWLYLNEEYLGGVTGPSLKRAVLSLLKPALARWDGRAAARADRYLANATEVRERIRRVYGREAPVIFPPHSVDTHGAQEAVPGLEEFASGSEYFLLVSRLLPYKN
ncbi:MAG TPA: glycosyltransferase, partial [Microbacteriaceae bacterium]